MTDQISELNNLLRRYDAPPAGSQAVNLRRVDQFIDEAYKLVSLLVIISSFIC